MKIEVERNGKILKINAKVAEVLMRKGIVREAYQTRDMARQPMLTKPMEAEQIASGGLVPVAEQYAVAEQNIEEVPGAFVAPIDLEDMDKEQLHALAKERGVKVHHMAGADKVREALRAAQ